MSKSELAVREEGGTPGSARTSQDSEQTSVVVAVGRLKQTEEQLYKAKKRLQVFRIRHEKAESSKNRQSRNDEWKDEIRNYQSAQKEAKNESQMRRSMEIEKYHQRSSGQRSLHERILSELRTSMQEKNKKIYETRKNERQKLQQAILQARQKQFQKRRSHRSKMSEEERKRQTYLKQFLQTREEIVRRQKQEQADAIMHQVQRKKKVLRSISKQESEVSCDQLNPESFNRLSKSLKKNQKHLA